MTAYDRWLTTNPFLEEPDEDEIEEPEYDGPEPDDDDDEISEGPWG